MFKVIDDPQFVEDVKVDTPDGSGWQQQILRTRFRAVPASEIEALDEAGGAIAILERVVIGFEDLADALGKPLDGEGEWRAKLLDLPYVRLPLLRHFYAAQAGVRLGNSGPSAAPGLGVN